ncbi:uncharacterized protein LOC116178006 isoform X2 [Photinus pyralis]|uniref:Uncharacterized protein n=1 Tax=Photinus pyralis TaxID=7054 RepID=A0A1Y1N3D9_PHOPY|nr:uncharacterized protein LOC116178006 isoform X2 [Photinus pyralis]
MVMGQFVTTYRKDYLWPYVRILGNKPAPDRLYEPQVRDPNQPLCPCHCLASPADRNPSGPNALNEQSWSRQGPMGPLLDPKLYPARVGRSPEVDTQRFNQPNVFLKKLQEKYPYIYEVLRTAPPDDLISRINKDRLRTTYQVDFCKMQEYPSAPYDQLLRSAGMEGLAPCPEPIKLPGDPCRPSQKPIAFRPATISKIKGGAEGGGEGKPCGGGLTGITPGLTEYQDGVSKVGGVIIREKLHYPKKK